MATGITETDVWIAADALLLEGARPTIERIRQKIGRGSPNTVSPYLETWFKSLGARIKDPGAFSAPPALPDPIHHAAKHFWETALASARAEVETHCADVRAELEVERARLVDHERMLEARQSAFEGQLAAKAEALSLAQGHLDAARDRIGQIEAELARHAEALQKSDAALEVSRAGAQAAGKQLESERAQWAAERRELEARQQSAESRWIEEVDRARQAAKRLEGELTREKALFEKESTARHQERERLATQAAAAAREAAVALKAADDAAAKTAQELAKAFADKETLGHRLSHLEAENERLITEVHGKEAERSALLAQVLHGQNQRKGNKRPSA